MSAEPEVPVNIKGMYKDLLADDPLKIISSIRDDLDEVVEKIISLDSDVVYIVGRKSNLLFRDFIDQIRGTKPVLMVESLKGDVFISRMRAGDVFLVVDAIHTGDEIIKFINALMRNREPPKISMIFCYISLIEGIKKINDLGLETYSKFLCNSEHEYTESVKKLQVYYQSQIYPIETDIIYDMYTIKKRDKRLILKLIRNSLYDIFDKKVKLKNNKIHAPEYIKQYSFISKELKPISAVLKKIPIIKNIQGLNKVVIIFIFKIKFDKDKILITFKNETMIDFITNQSKKTTKKCKLTYVDNKECSHNLIKLDKRKSTIKDMICANCVGNEINVSVMNLFKESFINHLKNYNIESSVKRIGNWLDTMNN